MRLILLPSLAHPLRDPRRTTQLMADDTETGEGIRALARRSDGDGAAQGVKRKKDGAAEYEAASDGGYAHPGEEAVVTHAATLTRLCRLRVISFRPGVRWVASSCATVMPIHATRPASKRGCRSGADRCCEPSTTALCLGGEFDPNALAQHLGGALQGQQRNRRIIGIEQPFQCGATGFHPLGQLGLGQFLLLHERLELESDHALDGDGFRFRKHTFLFKKIIKTATDVFAHVTTPGRLYDLWPVAGLLVMFSATS